MLSFILGLLGVDPLGKLLSALGDAQQRVLTAQTDSARIAAASDAKRLETAVALQQQTTAIRLQTSGFGEVRFLFFVLGACVTVHFGAICVGTTLAPLLSAESWLLHIPPLPPPFDTYEGSVIGFFFGSAAVMHVGTAIAGAIAGRSARSTEGSV